MLKDVAPPRTIEETKGRVGPIKRAKEPYINVREREKIAKVKAKERKANLAASQKLARKKAKVVRRENQLLRARDQVVSTKHALKEIKDALEGRDSKLIVEETLDLLPPTLREHVIEQGRMVYAPNPGPQTEFLAASEKEVFYGGARGGGKSYAMLLDPLRYCSYPRASALLIRRTMNELRDLIEESRKIYPEVFPGAKFREQEKEWRFPSGARIKFGYADSAADAYQYQGHSYSWIGVDELPQYPTSDIWSDLKGALRSVDPNVPTFMRATGNPGNIGSTWVREMFIDPAPAGEAFSVKIDTMLGTKQVTRRFIKAKLTDNPKLMQTDEYIIMLSQLPEYRRRQWLEGDWDVYDGAAFPEFSREIHVVQPFDIPQSWPRFRSCDWGYSAPACCLWFAVDPDGDLIVYRELYVTRMTADVFAQKVLALEHNDPPNMRGILDSSTWARRGDVGPSIAETMIRSGCSWRPSDRSPGSRINGKLEIHRRLAVDLETEKPRVVIFSNCDNLIRTMPQLPTDSNNTEDVDTHAEDHAYDAFRYGCMSRPISKHQFEDINKFMKEQEYQPACHTFGY